MKRTTLSIILIVIVALIVGGIAWLNSTAEEYYRAGLASTSLHNQSFPSCTQEEIDAIEKSYVGMISGTGVFEEEKPYFLWMFSFEDIEMVQDNEDSRLLAATFYTEYAQKGNMVFTDDGQFVFCAYLLEVEAIRKRLQSQKASNLIALSMQEAGTLPDEAVERLPEEIAKTERSIESWLRYWRHVEEHYMD